MRTFLSSMALCLSVLSAQAAGATFTDLYQVRQVLSESKDQVAAKDEALKTLLGRISSDKDARQKLGKDTEHWIKRADIDATGKALMVDFDAPAIEKALTEQGLSLWGANRPATLVWWLNQELDGSQLVGGGHAAAQVLQHSARYRGLPIRLPLADLSEQLVVDETAIRQANDLSEVSARYSPEAVLTVITEKDDLITAKWRVVAGDFQSKGTAQGQELTDVADQVMQQVVTVLAPQYQVDPSKAQNLSVEIKVQDINRYAQAERVMEAFSARLIEAKGQTVLYSLRAIPDQVIRQLEAVGLTTLADEPSALDDLSAEPAEPAEPGVASEEAIKSAPKPALLRFSAARD